MSENFISFRTEYCSSSSIASETKEPYRVLSLFSGCGGMDYGFEGGFTIFGQNYHKNSLKTVFANDISEPACVTLAKNIDVKPVVGSISDIPEEDFPNNIDVVTGGFPCQTFSHAGKREGLNSERGQLYVEMKRVINIVKPKMFVAENVDGLRTTKHGTDSTALDHIVKEFQQAGYNVAYKVLKAIDYGVPQTRVRIIIIGIDKKYPISQIYYPAPTHGDNAIFRTTYRTAYDAIDDLWEELNTSQVSNHSATDYSKAKFYPGRKMQGNNQILKDKPAPTIRAEHHGNIEAHYRTLDGELTKSDFSNVRRLTVRECARIQTFPDNFIFPGSASQAYRQIGNAVPPVLAWHVAQAVTKQLNELIEK